MEIIKRFWKSYLLRISRRDFSNCTNSVEITIFQGLMMSKNERRR